MTSMGPGWSPQGQDLNASLSLIPLAVWSGQWASRPPTSLRKIEWQRGSRVFPKTEQMDGGRRHQAAVWAAIRSPLLPSMPGHLPRHPTPTSPKQGLENK